MHNLTIKQTADLDEKDILAVEHAAFGSREDVAGLTRDLLHDPTSEPRVSLLAYKDDTPVGHILFTKARLENEDPGPLIYILAPLAVIPEFQKQGVGKALIKEGLRILKEMNVELVFVLGHPSYYPRSGFIPAYPKGYTATYPIPEKDQDAWMVEELAAGTIEKHSGRILCSNALDKPEHWKE